MRELKHLTVEEIEKADHIFIEGEERDEDDLAELLDLYRKGGVIYKYEMEKNESGRTELRVW